MALVAYKKKRKFQESPEPKGGKPSGDLLRFVIQKHKTSSLHYDLRLEMGGVLKSWAVPKGPSLNPVEKRLAMRVEDHPYDYKDFEGTIPKGNYGAGTVIIWDEGTYEPVGTFGKKSVQEKALLKQLGEGSLKFTLQGKKLKGEFALVKTKGMGENAWLLIKHRDRFAGEEDITQKDKSVVSRKTLEKVAAAIKRVTKGKTGTMPASGKAGKAQLEEQVNPKATDGPSEGVGIAAILRRAKKSSFPTLLSPMLATLVDDVYDDPGWEYEVKWDGYRALAFMHGQKTTLRSRNGNAFDDKFYPVFDALKAWGIHAVVDGEIVAVNEEGIASFSRLQNWNSGADGDLLYYVFDLLWYKGKDLKDTPLKDRKSLLQTLIPDDGIIRSGFSIKEKGAEFLDAATKLGLEGIVAKRSDSLYYPGERSKDWLKVKIQQRQEVVICGYTKNAGTSRLFSSLLLGVYKGGELQYAGKVGTGFKQREQAEMLALFNPLVRKTSPFAATPAYNKPSRFRPNPTYAPAIWLKPQLVCEVGFTDVTEGGVFRHPVFVAMREDKDAREVTRDKGVRVADAHGKGATSLTNGQARAKGRGSTFLHPQEKTQVKKIGGIELKFTNLDKVYWPDEGYTKRDVLDYYQQVSKYILPYLKGRPQSLNRFPNGIEGQSFYQKDVTGKVPDWVEKHPYKAEGERRTKHYMLCNNEAALLYMANLGAIEMNPWSSTILKPGKPDWCILDIDPDKGNTFEQVIEAARTIHDLLEELKFPSCCKTSGSTGLHIYIPLGARYGYEQSQLFAKWIAARADEVLGFTSIERRTDSRKGRVYLDYLQNRPAATLAAPYSLRPRPGATVSMPLHWDEVKKGLQVKDFTIKNALERVKAEGDLFKPVLHKGIDLKKILARLGKG